MTQNFKPLFSYTRNQNLLNTDTNPIFENFPTLKQAHSDNLEMCDEEEQEYMKDTIVIEKVSAFLTEGLLDIKELEKQSPLGLAIHDSINTKKFNLYVEYSYDEKGYGGMGPGGGGYNKEGIVGCDSLDESDVIQAINDLIDDTDLLEF